MVTVSRAKRAFSLPHELGISLHGRFRLTQQGQTIVEFTIAIILFIVVAWIPADFGLAFYTSQVAQNAAREGARIAAADSTLVVANSSCNMPACYTFGNIFNETAVRLPAALLTGASITVQYPAPGSAGTCNQQVLVRVQGQYNFFFYRVLGLLGAPVPSAVTVDRKAEMRWEHQSGCVGGAIP
jgi:Flp pilus assembly protein TadG